MKTKIIFVRHAEAEGNINREFHGWKDGKLTDKGHEQAKLVAERFKDIEIDALYVSSLTRTKQTSSYISKITGLDIIESDKLWEINGGDWEGNDWEMLPKKWPLEYENWENNPGKVELPNGESMIGFKERIENEINRIIKENMGKYICIVTHGTAIKMLMTIYRRRPLSEMINTHWQDNTSISIVSYEGEDIKIELEGDSSHLSDEMSTIKNQNWYYDYSDKFNVNEG